MKKNIRRAVIPAAGMGTRFLPATKSLPKEMLPIVNIPSIQYIVSEAINSGIEEILIVVSSSKNAIIDYFDRSYELENRLLENNKIKLYEEIKKISDSVKIHFIRQKDPYGLGDAIYHAKAFVGKEPFAVLLGDDVVITENNQKTALKQCMEAYSNTNNCIVGVQKILSENTNKYGIIKPSNKISEFGSVVGVESIVEKPETKDAPSNFAVMGRYIFTHEIFKVIEQTKADKSNEIQITDAIQKLCLKNKVSACNFVGKRYDIGLKEGFVIATIDMALKDKNISDVVKKHINSLCNKN